MLGQHEAYAMNRATRLAPALLDSFTSCSCYIFAALYALVTVGGVLALAGILATAGGVSYVRAMLGVGIGVGLGLALHGVPWYCRRCLARASSRYIAPRNATPLPRKVWRWFSGILLVGGFIWIVVHWIVEPCKSPAAALLSGIWGGAILAYVLTYLVLQFYANRKGRFSIPTLYEAWRFVLRRCRPIRPARDAREVEAEMDMPARRPS